MTAPVRHHLNVVGDFYVEDGCCTRCGLPESMAPDLFGWDDTHCWVRRQPEDSHELHRMIGVLEVQEFDCVRYGGTTPTTIRALALDTRSRVCDHSLDDPRERED